MANTRGKGLSLEASTAGLTRPERRAYAYSTLRPPTFSGDSLASAVWLTVRANALLPRYADLRRWGLKLAARGGKNAKKRAVVGLLMEVLSAEPNKFHFELWHGPLNAT